LPSGLHHRLSVKENLLAAFMLLSTMQPCAKLN